MTMVRGHRRFYKNVKEITGYKIKCMTVSLYVQLKVGLYIEAKSSGKSRATISIHSDMGIRVFWWDTLYNSLAAHGVDHGRLGILTKLYVMWPSDQWFYLFKNEVASLSPACVPLIEDRLTVTAAITHYHHKRDGKANHGPILQAIQDAYGTIQNAADN